MENHKDYEYEIRGLFAKRDQKYPDEAYMKLVYKTPSEQDVQRQMEKRKIAQERFNNNPLYREARVVSTHNEDCVHEDH